MDNGMKDTRKIKEARLNCRLRTYLIILLISFLCNLAVILFTFAFFETNRVLVEAISMFSGMIVLPYFYVINKLAKHWWQVLLALIVWFMPLLVVLFYLN